MLKPLISPRVQYLFVVVLAIFFYLFHSNEISLHPGRDMVTYYLYYRDFFSISPEFPLLMLFRTPITPFFFGLLMDYLGISGVNIILCTLYIICLVTIFQIARTYALILGYLALLLVGANIKFFYFFFSIASESPQSFILTLWVGYCFFTFFSEKRKIWISHAILIFILVLTRPGNQGLLLISIIPLLNIKLSLQKRVVLSCLFLTAYGVLHISYCTFNYIRYDSFTIAGLGKAHLPFYRIYLHDKLIRADNGPKSQELATMVSEKILKDETFEKYEIDIDTFFSASTSRMWDLLIREVAKSYGWKNEWQILRDVALEAKNKYPYEFWLGFIDQVRGVFFIRGDGRFDFRPKNRICSDFSKTREERVELYKELGLPIPSNNDLIPATGWWLSVTPENYIVNQEKIFLTTKAKPWDHFSDNTSVDIHKVFDIYGIRFPFVFLFLVLGCIGVIISIVNRFNYYQLIKIPVICLISLLTLLSNLMASPLPDFRYPFDPIFTLFGVHGIYYIYLFLQIKQIVRTLTIRVRTPPEKVG